mgnify:CR=1 FL=1
MKLLSSLIKEIKLASHSFYFYVEIGFAVVLLIVVAYVVPDNFTSPKNEEFLYFDGPPAAFEVMLSDIDDTDGAAEAGTFKVKGETIDTTLYENDESKYYFTANADDMMTLADSKNKTGAAIHVDSTTFKTTFDYYLQGYETQRLKNLISIFHVNENAVLETAYDSQEIRVMQEVPRLSDKINILPSLLTFNASLMGFFILAAYVYLDKKEGVIKAYAVTPSPIWHYLTSKALVVMLTALVTTLIIVIPIVGAQINYALLILLVLTTGFFGSGLGLILGGFYDDMEKSFGVLFSLMIVLGLPIIAYNLPSWDPLWVKFIPSYHIVYAFRELLVPNGDIPYVLWVSLAFTAAGMLLMWICNARYKRTLSV